jgi:topoisomerase IA-like protein
MDDITLEQALALIVAKIAKSGPKTAKAKAKPKVKAKPKAKAKPKLKAKAKKKTTGDSSAPDGAPTDA